MKSSRSNDMPPEMRWDESDALSRLLGESRLAEPPPWFAARTLALCRQQRRSGFWTTLRERGVQVWRWALAGGLAVSMAVALVVTRVPDEEPPQQHTVQEAFEVVAAMDSDSDSSTSSTWQDQSL